jgi:hypothetical protein
MYYLGLEWAHINCGILWQYLKRVKHMNLTVNISAPAYKTMIMIIDLERCLLVSIISTPESSYSLVIEDSNVKSTVKTVLPVVTVRPVLPVTSTVPVELL